MTTVHRILVAIGEAQERAVRVIALEVTAELQKSTPVDTGFARANWIPSVGAPVASPDGSRASVSSVAQQVGIAQVSVYKVGQGSVFITNNVHYVKYLNKGSSPQAPAEFVQAAIARGFQQAVAKLG